MKTITTVRWLLTVALLITAWRHSHWSVALVLTLIAVREELDSEMP
jgi:hypothetical protein